MNDEEVLNMWRRSGFGLMPGDICENSDGSMTFSIDAVRRMALAAPPHIRPRLEKIVAEAEQAEQLRRMRPQGES